MWVSGPLPRGRSHTRWSSSTSNEKRLTARWRTRRTLPRQVRSWLRRRSKFGELKAAAKAAAARPSGAAAKDSTLAAGTGGQGWRGKGQLARSASTSATTGTVRRADSCPFSHDKELRKQALAAKRGGEHLGR